VCSLDTLEHIKKDSLAISEISRVLRKNGIAIITVPHRKKYFTYQDRIIGHFRRYEIEQITKLFEEYHLKCIRYFSVYGKLMKIAFLQTLNPSKTEQSLLSLREKYQSSLFFKLLWKVVVNLTSKLMKIDAKYHKFKNGMNLGFIFIKV
jgi:ubiquinone/menaquinone biosynthesis C-methylase UbiE